MKIDFNTRTKMKNDISIVINHFFPKGIHELSIGNIWNIWFKTFENRRYPDNNPNVIFDKGFRLLSFNSDYELYPCNSKKKP